MRTLVLLALCSCAPTASVVKTGADVVVECVEAVAPADLAARGADRTPAETVARLTTPLAPQPGVSVSSLTVGTALQPRPESLRAGLAELEYALWGGRRFKTSAGVL